jgi:hypothetical protein
MRHWIAALALVVLAATPAAAAPPRVAIVPALAVNVDPHRVEALTGALADALGDKLEVDAVGGGDVARRLPPGGLPDDCVASPACITDLGTRLAADQILFVVIVQVGTTIQLDTTWADVATGKTVPRIKLDLGDDARASTVFGDAAGKLLPGAARRTTPHTTVVVNAPVGPTTTPHRLTTASWITAGVTVAAGATAVGLGLSTRSSYQHCQQDPCPADRISTIHHRAIAADLTGGLAIAAGVATAVMYWRSGGETVAVEPVPGGGAALTVGGRF